jgi:hypothetical protein
VSFAGVHVDPYLSVFPFVACVAVVAAIALRELVGLAGPTKRDLRPAAAAIGAWALLRWAAVNLVTRHPSLAAGALALALLTVAAVAAVVVTRRGARAQPPLISRA